MIKQDKECINALEKLKERELLQDVSSYTNFQKIYVGFDGTAESLQIGNLIPLASLRILSRFNISIIVILGGGTSRIGDPSGKTETRKQLDLNSINNNISKIESQIKKLLPEAKIINNATWLNALSFMDFLDNTATYVPVSKIIKLKTFAARLETHSPFSMKELIYPLLQGYDFLHLFENENCTAQLGGQDQWCNLLTGINLIKSKHGNNTNVLAITCPLLTDNNGNKMGKSLKGAIYLSKEKCPVFDFWNFWRNIDDSLVENCLKKFTELSINEIEDLIKKNINEAKIKLANELTTWIHSKEDAIKANNKATDIFINKNFENLPTIKINTNKLIEIISNLKNITNSKSKELIKQNSIKIDNTVINDITKKLNNGIFTIKIGKKDSFKIQII